MSLINVPTSDRFCFTYSYGSGLFLKWSSWAYIVQDWFDCLNSVLSSQGYRPLTAVRISYILYKFILKTFVFYSFIFYYFIFLHSVFLYRSLFKCSFLCSNWSPFGGFLKPVSQILHSSLNFALLYTSLLCTRTREAIIGFSFN